MSDQPSLPADPRERAAKFKEFAQLFVSVGKYDLALEVYGEAIRLTPGDIELHQGLREAGLKRRAAGGRAAGMGERWKAWRAKDPIAALVLRGHLLACDPGNTDAMADVLHAARQLELPNVEDWISNILRAASPN